MASNRGTKEGDRRKALESALGKIEREHGKGSIMRMGSDTVAPAADAIPTGSLGIDIATGIGGYPRGRVIEIFGPESSGKTTLALEAVANAQAGGGTCAFIDAEHALDPTYAAKLGCNVDELLISQPDSGDQALEIADTLVSSGAVDVIVVDSVAALTPKAELEGDMGDAQPGMQARLMSQALRKLASTIAQTRTTVFFINQIRMKIGVTFGSPETTTGGNALKFYASMRLDVRRIGQVKSRDEQIGNQTKVKIVKNKMASPFRRAEFDIIYGVGISNTRELIDLGEAYGVVEKSASWYSHGGTRIGQGKENAARFLSENPDAAEAIRSAVREAAGIGAGADGNAEARDGGASGADASGGAAGAGTERPAAGTGPP